MVRVRARVRARIRVRARVRVLSSWVFSFILYFVSPFHLSLIGLWVRLICLGVFFVLVRKFIFKPPHRWGHALFFF